MTSGARVWRVPVTSVHWPGLFPNTCPVALSGQWVQSQPAISRSQCPGTGGHSRSPPHRRPHWCLQRAPEGDPGRGFPLLRHFQEGGSPARTASPLPSRTGNNHPPPRTLFAAAELAAKSFTGGPCPRAGARGRTEREAEAGLPRSP